MEEALEEDRGHEAALSSVREEELCLWILPEWLACVLFLLLQEVELCAQSIK